MTGSVEPKAGCTFDYCEVRGFAPAYLHTYYVGDPPTDEQLLSRFLAATAGLLPRSGRFLELGCGPTVHHAIAVAPFVHELHLRDYLEENLDAVRAWQRGARGMTFGE